MATDNKTEAMRTPEAEALAEAMRPHRYYVTLILESPSIPEFGDPDDPKSWVGYDSVALGEELHEYIEYHLNQIRVLHSLVAEIDRVPGGNWDMSGYTRQGVDFLD
jgi:hypothetical protein